VQHDGRQKAFGSLSCHTWKNVEIRKQFVER